MLVRVSPGQTWRRAAQSSRSGAYKQGHGPPDTAGLIGVPQLRAPGSGPSQARAGRDKATPGLMGGHGDSSVHIHFCVFSELCRKSTNCVDLEKKVTFGRKLTNFNLIFNDRKKFEDYVIFGESTSKGISRECKYPSHP